MEVWAVGGVAFVFATAVWRLGSRGIATVSGGLSPVEWISLALLTAAFVYGEGVRAIERRWLPHVFERVGRLRRESSLVYRVLAPLYAMSLIGARRRWLAAAWGGVAAIALAVVIISRFPDPWRGIVDFAVAAALAWAVVALVLGSPRALRAQRAQDG